MLTAILDLLLMRVALSGCGRNTDIEPIKFTLASCPRGVAWSSQQALPTSLGFTMIPVAGIDKLGLVIFALQV